MHTMKRLAWAQRFLVTTCLLVCIQSVFASASSTQSQENLKSNGKDLDVWTLVTNAPWAARTWSASEIFNNRMWMLGGLLADGRDVNDVWSSADGEAWIEETGDLSRWSSRYLFEATVFNGQLWVMGGLSLSAYPNYYLNEVWSSQDGKTWVQATFSAGWAPRSAHRALVYNNKLWILGGSGSNGVLNDVWSSTDGKTWVQEVANASWPARGLHEVVVYKNRLWILGGSGGPSGEFNDVWSSTDGKTWVQEVENASWPARVGHQVLIYDDMMWVLGGGNGDATTLFNDVWRSEDGINWTQEEFLADWSPRFGHQAVTLNRKLFVMGGLNSDKSSDLSNEVWSTVSQNPSQSIVPDLTGSTESEAVAAITVAGLTFGGATSQYSETVAVGLVISQSPAPGMEVAPGASVSIVLSLGPGSGLIAVPDVGGMTESEASAAIVAVGLAFGGAMQENSASVPTGQVIRQTPAPGTRVNPGATVSIVVSLGPSNPGGGTGCPTSKGDAKTANGSLLTLALTFGALIAGGRKSCKRK